MARIALLSWGSHGDVLPFVALAGALRAAGHEVVLGAQPYHCEFVEQHGVRFHALGRATSVEQYQQLMERLIDEANPRKQLRDLLREMLLPDLEAQYLDALAALTGVELVVAHWMQIAGMAAAESRGLRCITVSLNPVGIDCVADTPAQVAATRNLGKMLSDYVWGDDFNRLRQRHGLPPVDSVAGYQYSSLMNLVAVSPALLPDRARYEARHRITGFWPLAESQSRVLPASVQAFLEAGEKPVVISFGSMGGRPGELTAVVYEAVRLAGCRAILQGGWTGLGHMDGMAGVAGVAAQSDNILRVDYVSHEILFEQAACVVHHGGAGTTAAALRAGVPSVIVWHMLDQPYWGHLLARLELGPQPLSRLGLQASELARRIEQACSRPGYQPRCQAVAQQLASEHGLVNALREIEGLLN
jgi:sterol 3beta-glucosyltransferase